MILIVTNRADVHVDELIKLANKRGTDVFRLNAEDILTEYEYSISLSAEGRASGKIVDSLGREFDLSKRQAAWFRKPSDDITHPSISPDFYTLVRSEANALLETLYRWPNLHWVNCPLRANSAKSKLQQLEFASKFDISVPETIITNVSRKFLDFAKAHDWNCIVKAIYTGNFQINDRPAAIPTTEFSETHAKDISDRLSVCPTLAQPKIQKSYELRVTVVGRKVFSVMIDSQSNELTRVDWRPYTELCRHSVHELPNHISQFCISFLDNFDLSFGAFDFIVDVGGEYIFLECNPFGQYLWTEYETNLPITEALLDHLTSLCSP